MKSILYGICKSYRSSINFFLLLLHVQFQLHFFPVTVVPTLSLSSMAYNVSESDGSVRVCVLLNTPLTFVLDLFITTTDGTATEGKKDANL